MANHAEQLNISSLKVIDLSNPDLEQSVSLLKQACLDTGFFYVINHGLSQEFIDEMFAQSKKFFTLPMEEKMKVLRDEKYRGYTPILDEVLDRGNQVHGDYKEGFYIGIDVPESEYDKPFNGPNIWPSPDVLPGWKEIMEKYHRETLKVGKAVARIIALALGLDYYFFDTPEMLDNPIVTMRLLHYDDRAHNPDEGIYGCGAHSDYGLISLLLTDDVMALQICRDRDAKPRKWEYVPPMKGAFIVNLGDMLERWSNCVFKSTLHRVVGSGQERYSIAYFINPSHDCLVECLPTCKSETNPPKYPPIKCAAYLSKLFKDTHADLSSYKQQA